MSAALLTDVDKRLLRTTKFPSEFDVKVDMSKVNVSVIKKWIADELARLLNSDDDVVIELVFNILESSSKVGGSVLVGGLVGGEQCADWRGSRTSRSCRSRSMASLTRTRLSSVWSCGSCA